MHKRSDRLIMQNCVDNVVAFLWFSKPLDFWLCLCRLWKKVHAKKILQSIMCRNEHIRERENFFGKNISMTQAFEKRSKKCLLLAIIKLANCWRNPKSRLERPVRQNSRWQARLKFESHILLSPRTRSTISSEIDIIAITSVSTTDVWCRFIQRSGLVVLGTRFPCVRHLSASSSKF